MDVFSDLLSMSMVSLCRLETLPYCCSYCVGLLWKDWLTLVFRARLPCVRIYVSPTGCWFAPGS